MSSAGFPWPRPLGTRVAALLPKRSEPAAIDPVVASVASGIAGMVRGLPPAVLIELVYDRLGAALGLGPVFGARLPPAPADGNYASAFTEDFALYLRQLSRAELLRIAEPWLRRHVLGEQDMPQAEPDLGRLEELEEALAGRDAREDARWREQRDWLATLGGFIDELVRQRDAAQADAAATRSEAIRALVAQLRVGELEQELAAARATIAELEARAAAPRPVEPLPPLKETPALPLPPTEAAPEPAAEEAPPARRAPRPRAARALAPAQPPAVVAVDAQAPAAEEPAPAPAPIVKSPRVRKPRAARARRLRAAPPPVPAAPPPVAAPLRMERPRRAPSAPLPATPVNLDAFKPRPVAEVTEPRHYFLCGRWKSTIAAEDCGSRHTLANKEITGGGTSRNVEAREAKRRFERCAGCEVGAELLVRLRKKPAPPPPAEGGQNAA